MQKQRHSEVCTQECNHTDTYCRYRRVHASSEAAVAALKHTLMPHRDRKCCIICFTDLNDVSETIGILSKRSSGKNVRVIAFCVILQYRNLFLENHFLLVWIHMLRQIKIFVRWHCPVVLIWLHTVPPGWGGWEENPWQSLPPAGWQTDLHSWSQTPLWDSRFLTNLK